MLDDLIVIEVIDYTIGGQDHNVVVLSIEVKVLQLFIKWRLTSVSALIGGIESPNSFLRAFNFRDAFVDILAQKHEA